MTFHRASMKAWLAHVQQHYFDTFRSPSLVNVRDMDFDIFEIEEDSSNHNRFLSQNRERTFDTNDIVYYFTFHGLHYGVMAPYRSLGDFQCWGNLSAIPELEGNIFPYNSGCYQWDDIIKRLWHGTWPPWHGICWKPRLVAWWWTFLVPEPA
jgi:hypothetical protein